MNYRSSIMFIMNVPDTVLFFIRTILELLKVIKGYRRKPNRVTKFYACIAYLPVHWPWTCVIEIFDSFVFLCHILSKAKHYVIFICREWPTWMNPTNIFVLYYWIVHVFFGVADTVEVFFLVFVECHGFGCHKSWEYNKNEKIV